MVMFKYMSSVVVSSLLLCGVVCAQDDMPSLWQQGKMYTSVGLSGAMLVRTVWTALHTPEYVIDPALSKPAPDFFKQYIDQAATLVGVNTTCYKIAIFKNTGLNPAMGVQTDGTIVFDIDAFCTLEATARCLILAVFFADRGGNAYGMVRGLVAAGVGSWVLSATADSSFFGRILKVGLSAGLTNLAVTGGLVAYFHYLLKQAHFGLFECTNEFKSMVKTKTFEAEIARTTAKK
jgi:hypothetical protein